MRHEPIPFHSIPPGYRAGFKLEDDTIEEVPVVGVQWNESDDAWYAVTLDDGFLSHALDVSNFIGVKGPGETFTKADLDALFTRPR